MPFAAAAPMAAGSQTVSTDKNEDPVSASATKVAQLIREKKISATEIVKAAYAECNIPRRRAFELLAELKAAGLIKQPRPRGNYEPI